MRGAWPRAILAAAGTPPTDAARVVDSLIYADGGASALTA